MGFTIEDMMTVSAERYQMQLAAGRGGWSNSISWLLMLEDLTITQNFSGKELAVTTGLGFQSADKLMALARALVEKHASGLLINTGRYILQLPPELIAFCDESDLPLLTVPWDIVLADLIKDLSIRIFLQGDTDEQISASLIRAIEDPENREQYSRHLLSHFDVDGSFQAVLLSTEGLDRMDTVDRRRLSYRMHLYLTNLTHNAHFFYYDSVFVLIINDVDEETVRSIVERFRRNLSRRMPERRIVCGISDSVQDISRLHLAYKRALAALSMAEDCGTDVQYFREMGLYRLLYLVPDTDLLHDLGIVPLQPLLSYDEKHAGQYVETLEAYLQHDGSIQAAAEALFTHRNTVLYRMNNIRRLLGSDLSSPSDRLRYLIACSLTHMSRVRPHEQA